MARDLGYKGRSAHRGADATPSTPSRPSVKAPITGLMPRNCNSTQAPISRYSDGSGNPSLGGVVVNIYWTDIQQSNGAVVDITKVNGGGPLSSSEWVYYRDTLTPANCGGTRPPCRIRVFVGQWAPSWAMALDSSSPIVVYDSGGSPNNCPRWWGTNYQAKFDALMQALGTGGGPGIKTSGGELTVDGTGYAGLEAMPFVRSIAVHVSTVIYAEPCQRRNSDSRNRTNYIAAGLNDGTSTTPNTLDAASLFYQTTAKWSTSYGFTTTPLYYAWNPFQQWNGSTGASVTDPGAWTETTGIPTVATELTSRGIMGNNSGRLPFYSIGEPYVTTFQAIAASSALGVSQQNSFQTATLSSLGGSGSEFGQSLSKPAYAVYTPPADTSEYNGLYTALQVLFGEITPLNQAQNYYSCLGFEASTLPMRARSVELPGGWKTATHQGGATTGLSLADCQHFNSLAAGNPTG